MTTATHASSVKNDTKMIQINPKVLLQIQTHIDDQIATAKLLQGEIDLLTGNYEEFTPSHFLHDIKRRRNITV